MINTTGEIIFLNKGENLSKAVHEAISSVWTAIRSHHDFCGDLNTITTNDQSISFLRFFGKSFHDEHPVISEEDVIKLYKVIKHSRSNPPSNIEIKSLCLCNVQSDRIKVTKSYFGGIKLGLQIAFIKLWTDKAIILPYDFEPPRCTYIFDEINRDTFFTPVLAEVRKQNSRFNAEIKFKNTADKNMLDSRAVCWLKLILATSWYKVCDLTLDELLEVRDLNGDKGNTFTNCKLQIHALIYVLLDAFDQQISFSRIEFDTRQLQHFDSLGNVGLANEYRVKLGKDPIYSDGTPPSKQTRNSKSDKPVSIEGKLAEKLSEMYNSFSSLNVEQLAIKIESLTTSHMGNAKSALTSIYETVVPSQYNQSLKYWLNVQRIFKDKKRYEDNKGLFFALGLFNSYLFIYLPWWYLNNAQSNNVPVYPSTLNKLNCEVFINRWIYESEELPLDFLQFAELIGKVKGWSNNTHYGSILPIVTFLRWCENKKRRLDRANYFENLLDTDDLPNTISYKQSQKTPLSRRVFKMFVQFCFALYEFQEKLEEKVKEGKVNPQVFGGVNNFITFVDKTPTPKNKRYRGENRTTQVQPIEFCLKDFDLEQPYICLGAEEDKYPVNSFYKFFFHKEYLLEGERKPLIYPGDLILCLLSMNTGIRGAHLTWLDLDSFDMRVNLKLLNDPLHALTVSTDKVKKGPWVSTVSATTINLCLAQKNWRKQISDSSFNQHLFYKGNENSKFGAFRPLFSYQADTGMPTPNMEKCFLALLMSFDQFLRDNGFEEEPMFKIRPSGHKYYGELNPDNIEIKTTASGLSYTPLTYAKRATIHASRNSVVKESVRYLPESIVGKHITGQTERLVSYYNLIDPEDHCANQSLQWRNDASSTAQEANLSNVAFDSEMPSNIAGSVMHKGIIQNPSEAIDAYGLISIHIITDDNGNPEDGVSKLKAKGAFKLACNPTHFCPFDNVCPKEIIDDFQDIKPCPVCPYAISGVNHIPAISAAKDACYEEFRDAKEKLKELRKGKSKDLEMLSELESICDKKIMYTNAWEYRENDLFKKVEGIKQGFESGCYTVGKPEFIANMLEATVFEEKDNEAAYILKRLRDCKSLPLLETKQIAAKFEKYRRKLMALKDPASALVTDVSMNPTKELYSLIQSYKELHGITNTQITKLLELSPDSLMESLNSNLDLKNLLEVNNG